MDDRILDRYRLIERLASGGSAEVWRAHDEQLDRPVAVKRLHAHLLPDDASRKRLAAEARAAAALSHPAIVGVYDVDIEGEGAALVMELVEGESLAARIDRDGPLQPAEAALLVAEVADALFHAHQRGVIHRDVKPGNVLLARDGRVRLVDFGIASSLADAGERLTQTGTVVGTLRSMAPEQLAGGSITPRTDLYGLGVVLYEALIGRPPYPSATPLALAEAQRRGPPSIDGLDPGLAGIVTSCLAYDPADRPLHAGALAQALRAWAAGAPTAIAPGVAHAGPAVPASPAPLGAAARADGGHEATRTAPVAGRSVASVRTSRNPSRRVGPGWLPAALAIVALALLVGWLALGGLAGDGLAESLPSPTPEPTASPSPTPPPEWATELAADVAEACGDGSIEVFDLVAMGEDAADDYADDLVEACDEEADGGDEGRGNRGGGNGGGGNGAGGNGAGGNGGGGNGGRGGGD